MPRLDPHSFHDTEQPSIVHFSLKARVDFGARRLDGEVALRLATQAAAGPLDLDTRDLDILDVTDDSGRALRHALSAPEPILGSRLRVELSSGIEGVRVKYRTRPEASALQWLEPAQTSGGRHPYLFSQCQAIHARSVVPLQDTPRVRVRFHVELQVPPPLRAVVAARPLGDGHFEMPETIPPYLFAFAVGNLDSRELGPRSRVWAEPEVVERAAWEFAGVDELLRAAEGLFGPYPWERFDILVMPPSFPYGGMENPRLAFLTPTLLAGDRSLVNVVAHELAHSWTGNLVSNASAEHFWLNEGFTVFAERRILEVVEGSEVCALHAALGRRSLDEAIERFRAKPELTRLRTHLAGVDPDEAFSQVPYEKGYLFLRALEESAGRESFARFLKDYVAAFRFQSITTEDFAAFARARLPEALSQVGEEAWLEGNGLPANAPAPRSQRLDALGTMSRPPPEAAARAWTPVEWQLFLESTSRPAPAGLLETLDADHGLTRSRNDEVLVAWLCLGVASGYAPAIARTQEFLGTVGRLKYLRPLYAALARNAATSVAARETFARFQARYHPIAQHVIRGVLEATEPRDATA
jgi:leukotriene-A4 hydrolase